MVRFRPSLGISYFATGFGQFQLPNCVPFYRHSGRVMLGPLQPWQLPSFQHQSVGNFPTRDGVHQW